MIFFSLSLDQDSLCLGHSYFDLGPLRPLRTTKKGHHYHWPKKKEDQSKRAFTMKTKKMKDHQRNEKLFSRRSQMLKGELKKF